MCCCYAALALWSLYSTHNVAEPPTHLSPRPNGLRKPAQQFQCLVPSHTRIGDTLAIHQRFPCDQLLCSCDQIALQHDADDVPVSLGNLPCDIAANRRLARVVFAAVGMAAINHDARWQPGLDRKS